MREIFDNGEKLPLKMGKFENLNKEKLFYLKRFNGNWTFLTGTLTCTCLFEKNTHTFRVKWCKIKEYFLQLEAIAGRNCLVSNEMKTFRKIFGEIFLVFLFVPRVK
jgi:hypothetical protein